MNSGKITMFLQWVLIRSPCFAFLMSSQSLFSSWERPRFRVRRDRDGNNGMSSSRDIFELLPWFFHRTWILFFLSQFFSAVVSVCFLRRHQNLFLPCYLPSSSSSRSNMSNFTSGGCHEALNLVFRYADDCRHHEDDRLGSLQLLWRSDIFFLFPSGINFFPAFKWFIFSTPPAAIPTVARQVESKFLIDLTEVE